MMSGQHPHPGDMRHSQIPVGYPTPPLLGLDIDRCIIFKYGILGYCYACVHVDYSFFVCIYCSVPENNQTYRREEEYPWKRVLLSPPLSLWKDLLSGTLRRVCAYHLAMNTPYWML